VTVPIYGRLADVFGRKPVLFAGIAIFLIGSALSGAAWSMMSLIVFRGLQGIGAGAVQPIAMTIVGDLYSVEQRGRIQGYLSGVWGVAAVLGPALGGVLSQYATWRWIFYLNLPVGAIAALMIERHFHEQVVRTAHRIDYFGAITLMVGLSLLIFGLLQGDVHWAWRSPPEVIILALGIALLGSLVAIERRAAEPFLPPWLFTRRTLIVGNLASLGVGALLVGLSSYVPTFSQGVVGVGPVLAGFALAGQSVTWVAGSVISGRLYPRTGFRYTALIGATICTAGAVVFALLRASVPLGLVALAGSILGVGFGFASTSVLVAVQSTVDWERRGVVTGANIFGRTIGGALGVTVFGSIANATLTDWLRHPPAALASQLPHSANAASFILGGSSAIHNFAASRFVREGLFLAVHHIFLALVLIAVGLVLTVALLPRNVVALSFDAPAQRPSVGEPDLGAPPVRLTQE
jgi:MFS family permease